MPVSSLDHCSIRTVRLEESRKFYVDVLGMTEGDRPDFPFPGHWLYVSGLTVVHLVGVDPDDSSGLSDYLGGEVDPEALQGSGSLDHVAFRATAAHSLIQRFKEHRIPYRERQVPNMDLYQLFVEDPNGITVELNFFGAEQQDVVTR